MRPFKYPWLVIWCANFVFLWAFGHWGILVFRIQHTLRDQIAYATNQGFCNALAYTWFWWYAYQKNREKAGGELPALARPKQTFFSRAPFFRYRFGILWAIFAGAVALATLIARLLTGRPSFTTLAAYTVILPTLALAWWFVLDRVSRPMFRETPPDTPADAAA